MAKTMMEIRARLYVLAKDLNCAELKQLADATKRRFFGRVAPTRQAKLTYDMMVEVRAAYKLDPKISQRALAARFKIDQGRVNEILHGYRDGTPFRLDRVTPKKRTR